MSLADVATLTFIGNFLIAFLTPYADEGIGYVFGFVFFACNLIAAGIVYFFLFDSRLLSLESVDMMYSDGSIKPRTSKKWVPPSYINRLERDEAYRQCRPSGLENMQASDLPGKIGGQETL
jgi:SP family sugar:H+ symporter-like MFS transporter